VFRYALADVNLDGHVDLVAPSFDNDALDTLVRFDGSPDGLRRGVRFETDAGSTPDLLGGKGPRHVAIADLTGDGVPDLVTANNSDAADITVLRGNGLGRFTDVEQLVLPDDGWPDRLWLADVTGNGSLDIVTLDGRNDRLVVYQGNPWLGYDVRRELPLSEDPTTYAPFDVDQDGDAEMLVFGREARLGVVDWDGDALFEGGTLDAVPCSVFAFPARGDVDADGFDDLLLECSETSALGLLTHTTGPGAAAFRALPCADCAPFGAQLVDTDLQDVDGDGHLDALATWSDRELAIFWSDGTRPQGGPSRWFVNGFDFWFPFGSEVEAGDVTGDGTPDLVVSGLYGPVVIVGLGQRRFLPAGGLLSTLPGRHLAVGRLASNDRDDLVVAQTWFRSEAPAESAGSLVWWVDDRGRSLARGSNLDVDPETRFEPGHDVQGLAVGDLDEDGLDDAVWVSDFDDVYVVHLGASPPSLGFSVLIDTPSPGTRDVTLVDADDDGHVDLIGLDPLDRRLDVRGGRGDATFGLPSFPEVGPPGAEPVELVVTDLSGDGLAELVLIHTGNDVLSTARATGALTWEAPVVRALSQRPRALAVGDVDGDGRKDVAVLGDQGIDVFLGMGEGDLAAPLRLPAPDDPRDLVVFDANGDGSDDLVTSSATLDQITVIFTGP
ncbi:MAG: VCBS repeat-containing protein, partial [Myxococcota bacterium]